MKYCTTCKIFYPDEIAVCLHDCSHTLALVITASSEPPAPSAEELSLEKSNIPSGLNRLKLSPPSPSPSQNVLKNTSLFDNQDTENFTFNIFNEAPAWQAVPGTADAVRKLKACWLDLRRHKLSEKQQIEERWQRIREVIVLANKRTKEDELKKAERVYAQERLANKYNQNFLGAFHKFLQENGFYMAPTPNAPNNKIDKIYFHLPSCSESQPIPIAYLLYGDARFEQISNPCQQCGRSAVYRKLGLSFDEEDSIEPTVVSHSAGNDFASPPSSASFPASTTCSCSLLEKSVTRFFLQTSIGPQPTFSSPSSASAAAVSQLVGRQTLDDYLPNEYVKDSNGVFMRRYIVRCIVPQERAMISQCRDASGINLIPPDPDIILQSEVNDWGENRSVMHRGLVGVMNIRLTDVGKSISESISQLAANSALFGSPSSSSAAVASAASSPAPVMSKPHLISPEAAQASLKSALLNRVGTRRFFSATTTTRPYIISGNKGDPFCRDGNMYIPYFPIYNRQGQLRTAIEELQSPAAAIQQSFVWVQGGGQILIDTSLIPSQYLHIQKPKIVENQSFWFVPKFSVQEIEMCKISGYRNREVHLAMIPMNSIKGWRANINLGFISIDQLAAPQFFYSHLQAKLIPPFKVGYSSLADVQQAGDSINQPLPLNPQAIMKLEQDSLSSLGFTRELPPLISVMQNPQEYNRSRSASRSSRASHSPDTSQSSSPSRGRGKISPLQNRHISLPPQGRGDRARGRGRGSSQPPPHGRGGGPKSHS